MRTLIAVFILSAVQLMSLQPGKVVHLAPHTNFIEEGFNGCTVELIDAPDSIHLPVQPPKPGSDGTQWAVVVKNFGPRPVRITNDQTHFDTVINVGQTLRIFSNGSNYILKR